MTAVSDPQSLYFGLPVWIVHAGYYSGLSEVPGDKDNEQIVAWLAACGLPNQHDETAWCSAFANGVMRESGFRTLNKANARSWLQWGAPLTAWRFGCVGVYWREDPNGPHGHVGFPLMVE